jgi:hypothetical protein
MPINELTTLELPKLSKEQRLKITAGIVDDLIRALNLGNYSLIWRYISNDYSKDLTADVFSELHQQLSLTHGELTVEEQASSELDGSILYEQWWINTKNSDDKLFLELTLVPIKEFLVIEQLTIKLP